MNITCYVHNLRVASSTTNFHLDLVVVRRSLHFSLDSFEKKTWSKSRIILPYR